MATASQPGFLWFDYETFGRDPRQDRPSQFAAIRTDLELNPVGEPMNWYCAPVSELVPSPDACLLTGITPQQCAAEGLPEREFAARIQHAMQLPGTCAVGYNSMRFDDEVTRFLFYRNLLPVYDREWRNGNSRWDLLDVMRLAYALRPEGMIWPERADGAVSFRLEDLARANNIDQEQAHDALSDVRATIGLARSLRSAQPRLYEWALKCRDKHFVKSVIPVLKHQPFVHVSGMIPASQGCLTVLIPLMFHPQNPNEIICFDLQQNPAELNGLSAATIRHRLFTPQAELGPAERLAIKSVHINKSPMVGPMSLFSPQVAARLGLDRDTLLRHAETPPDLHRLAPELEAALARTPLDTDAEQALYAGFPSRADQGRLQQLHRTPAADWLTLEEPDDDRLQVLWRRFIARYYPEDLPAELQSEWQHYQAQAVRQAGLGGSLGLTDAQARLQELQQEHPDSRVLADLARFLAKQSARLRSWESA